MQETSELMSRCQERLPLTFPKEERLHHKSLIDKLFKEGKTFYEYPLRVTWKMWTDKELMSNFRSHLPEGIGKIQVMVSVPKKKRKRAVDRVLLRRRIRETYRLNRLGLRNSIDANEKIRTMSLAFIYLHDSNISYRVLEEKMIAILRKLISKIENMER